MPSWASPDLDIIRRNPDFYVSPLREDGITYGTPTRTWALVVDGQVFVRAASGPASRWYQAAITQGAGRVRVENHDYEVTFAQAPTSVGAAIDAAYEDKYPGNSAVATMQGEGPTSATVLITPR
jgi:hypothetical protein